jgi:hypothetical protein
MDALIDANVAGQAAPDAAHKGAVYSLQANEIDDDKIFTTLRATLAFQGVGLYRLADGGFLATRWNLSRLLADAEAVVAFARQLKGAL